MKKMYMLFWAAASCLAVARAQNNAELPFRKGDKLLGGSIGAVRSSLPGSGGSNTMLQVSPSFGVFTKPNRVTGLSLFFNTPSLSQSGNYGYGAAVFRQYWTSLGKNFYFTIQGAVTGSFQKMHSYYDPTLPNYNQQRRRSYTAAVNLLPGFAYRVTRRLVVDATLSDIARVDYTHERVNYTIYTSTGFVNSRERINRVSVSSSLIGLGLDNVRIGFRYVL